MTTLAAPTRDTIVAFIADIFERCGDEEYLGEAFTMADTQDRYHEEAGTTVLAQFFPRVVIDCVRYHVSAKRYLCAARPAYLARLSAASVHSLNLQGGPMSEVEAAAFETMPNLKEIIQVRHLDDAGKDPAMETPDFAHFAPAVQRVVDRYLG